MSKELFFILIVPVAAAFYIFGVATHAWWIWRFEEEPPAVVDEFGPDVDWRPGELTEAVDTAPDIPLVQPTLAELVPEDYPVVPLVAEATDTGTFQVRAPVFEDEAEAALYAVRRQFAAIRENTETFLRPALEPAAR